MFFHVLFETDPFGTVVHDLFYDIVGILRKVIVEYNLQEIEQFGFVGEHLLDLRGDVVALQHVAQLFFRYFHAYAGCGIADEHFLHDLVKHLFVDACRVAFGQRHAVLLAEHGLHLFGAAVYQCREFLCCHFFAVYHDDLVFRHSEKGLSRIEEVTYDKREQGDTDYDDQKSCFVSDFL